MSQMFIDWLNAQIGSIYVWGGQGETNITEAWIRKVETSTENANRAIAFWQKQKAKGVSPLAAYDCSGLITQYMLVNKLRSSDTTSQGLYNESTKISSKSSLSAYDLVFRYDGSKIYHVGVYIGGGEVIHAKGRDYGVVRETIDYNGTGFWNSFGTIAKLKTGTTAVVLKITSPLMRSDAIKSLQTALNALGYACGTVDGICGQNTMSGVKAFSKVHTGGATTAKATLLKITSPLMRSDAIKTLQTALNALGYACGTADGICGQNTMSGVTAFGKAHV